MVDDFTGAAARHRAGSSHDTGRRGEQIAAYYQHLLADQRIDLYACDRRGPAPEQAVAAPTQPEQQRKATQPKRRIDTVGTRRVNNRRRVRRAATVSCRAPRPSSASCS